MARHRWDPVCDAAKALVRPVRVDPSGVSGPTKRQASGPHWRSTSLGFHVPAGTSSERPEQRILEQSVRLPEGGAVTGWAACRLHRAAFFDGLGRDGTTPRPVPLALGPAGNVRGDDRVVLNYERLDPTEITWILGIPCTKLLRATFDAMRHSADDREAVVTLDMMAAAERVSIARMSAYAGVCRRPSRPKADRASAPRG